MHRIAVGLTHCFKETYTQAEASKDARKQLHASLALVPVDPGQKNYLYKRLLEAEAHELTIIRGPCCPTRQN